MSALLGVFGPFVLSTHAATNLVFDEEFSGSTSNLDLTKWSFDLGNSSTIAGDGWGNQESQVYTSRTNNIYVANGLLHIIVLNDQGGSTPYSSARIHTLGHFSMTYGRVEFRAKLPANGSYWWPALWMLATNNSDGANGINNIWPRCGEIDVCESMGSTPGDVLGTLHKDSSGNPGVDQANGGQFNFPAGDGTTNFHTYVMSWYSNKFTFAVDNNAPYKTITTWTSSTGPFPAPFNHPFYIVMNLAVGGQFFGTPPSVATINAASTFPAEMQIDYVRVYEDTNGVFGLPGVTSIVPNNGCQSGGTPISITGSNFASGTTVTIGGLACTSLIVNSNAITCNTPASGTASSKTVILTYPDTSTTNITHGFTYNGPPSFAGLAGITPAIGGATLTWSAASGGTAPVVYKVYQATSSGGENFGSPVLTTSSLAAFISPLNCTNTYYFVVRTSDGCNATDGNSVELSVQPQGTPPVFAGLTNVTAAIDAATLSWAAGSGTPPLSYNVFEATTSGAENFGSPVLTTNSLSAFISPLNCSNTYYFVVRASGGCGNSENNAVEHSVQPQAAPIVFSGLVTATAATGGATLSWSAASGESPIAYKVFQATSSGGENFGSPVLTTSGLSIFIPSLHCSNTYYFVVRAVGGCGTSDNNSVERSVQPLPVPVAFSGLANITAATEGATLTWSAASGESPLTYNVFEATASGAQNFGSPMLTTNSLTAFVAPLYPGSNSPITYFFVVRAQGGCGSGESNTVEQPIQPLLDPNKSQVGDGIPNGWKQQYGFSPFDTATASADTDGDGMSNLQEFLAGTDPTNTASYFHITSITQSGDDILVAWLGGGGHTNIVQATFDLGASFADISSNIILSGTGDSLTNYLDLSAATNSSPLFYRIRLAP